MTEPVESARATDRGHTTAPVVTIRRIETWSEYRSCVALQQEVWGVDFPDLVPAAILKVSQRIGGVTAGAFEPDGRLIGFVFGITGVEHGRLVHWSDMLGVRADARDRGIGKQLKAFQCEAVRALGVLVMYWTYDPLVARNAHLNLMQLGADVVEYVADMYGPQTSSVLHAGLGTDRFVVAWRTDAGPPRPPPALPPLGASEVPIINPASERPAGAPWVRIAVPLHIDRVQRTSMTEASQWRAETRSAFQWALAHGYRVVGFQRDPNAGIGLYALAHKGIPALSERI